MYATLSDMQSRFEHKELVQVTDQVGNEQIDEDFVNQAIADACSEMDSYLSTKYQLPINPVPPILTRYACDIARYNLFGLKSNMPEVAKTRYDSAIKFLKSVAAGTARLDATGIETAPTAEATILSNIPPRMFSRESLKGY